MKTLTKTEIVRIDGDPRFKLIPQPRGDLRIWQMPEPGMRYVIGGDTAGGKVKGDFCVGVALETSTRAMVAKWKGKYEPREFGRMLARLGWFYNGAMLAIETHPSQHGLSTHDAAVAAGYALLFRRRQEGTISGRYTDEKGWATTDRTKGKLVDCTREALADGYDIPDYELLEQLLTCKRNDKGKIEFEGHDDDFIAYSIGLRVCELCVESGFVSDTEPEPRTWEEQHWKERKKALDLGARVGPKLKAWDGT